MARKRAFDLLILSFELSKGHHMKLSTVALITLLIITAGYVLSMSQSIDILFDYPLTFLSSSLGTWALMFFFFMLYRHTKED